MRGVPWEAASATSWRASASYFRKTGGEKRNRFGRVFEFKSTVFGRFETATHPRYAPQKLDSRVALLEKVHRHVSHALSMCLVGSVCNGARFITSQTVRFVPVRMVQDSYKDWLSTAEIMKSEEKNDANRRNSGDIRMLGTN